MGTPSTEMLGALNLFVAGVQKILLDNHAKWGRRYDAPRIGHSLGTTKATVYSINHKGERTDLSYVNFETGAVMLPTDKTNRSRGNIFNPDHGLKNIASDGRPAFVR